MDAIRKQASKLREQVGKQSQALGSKLGLSSTTAETIVTDNAELQRFQQLEKLSVSTRAGKHFQRDVMKGVEGMVMTGLKQLEVAQKLAEDCKKYGTEGPTTGGALARAAVHYGNARLQVERERDQLNRSLSTMVAEPLKAMVSGQPLEDARHLVSQYETLRKEAEAQVANVGKRQEKARGVGGTADAAVKLQIAEQQMSELSSKMAVLGKEAAAAMSAVEAQQQRLTLQRLITMAEIERSFYQKGAEYLDQLCATLVSERQRSESLPPTPMGAEMDEKTNGARPTVAGTQKAMYFLAEVMHAFEAESENELSLTPGDFVVVRQQSASGWSEGECKKKAGWFPSQYAEARQRVPASKIIEDNAL